MALDGETVVVSAVSRCPGVNGEELFGIEHGAFAMKFPWGFAAKPAQTAVFTAELNGVVWAAGCTGGLDLCLVCAALPYNDTIRKIQGWVAQPNRHLLHVSNVYLSLDQMADRVRHNRAQRDRMKLQGLNQGRALIHLTEVQEVHKGIMMLLAEKNIARIHVLLARHLREGRSPAFILETISFI